MAALLLGPKKLHQVVKSLTTLSFPNLTLGLANDTWSLSTTLTTEATT